MRTVSQYGWQGLGLEFWLSLPLLTSVFWFSCDLIMAQGLSRPYGTQNKLQAHSQLEVYVSAKASIIKAVLDRTQGITRVTVQTIESNLKQLEFEFPVTDTHQVETAIAQELGLSLQDVRKLVRYEILE